MRGSRRVRVRRLDESLELPYEKYVSRHPLGLLYHSNRYRRFLIDLLGCGEDYLLALDEEEKIRGVMPLLYHDGSWGRVYNSLPFFGSNGGLLSDGAPFSDVLARAYESRIEESGVLSGTVVGHPFSEHSMEAVPFNLTDERISQFTRLDLGAEPRETLMERIDGSGRRNIRKAIAEGVEVEVDFESMDFLREIHQENMRAVDGRAKSEAFFDRVPHHFRAGEDYDLFLASCRGRPVASLLLFYYNGVAEYFIPATRVKYRSMQAMPLIIFEAMVRAARKGMEMWNWGGTWPSQIGVYRFKKKWAAEERRYEYRILLNDRTVLMRSAEQVLEEYPYFYVVPFSELSRSGGGTRA